MQLILTLHDMAKAIQSSSIHAVVLDLAKAFDKVPHRRLLKTGLSLTCPIDAK